MSTEIKTQTIKTPLGDLIIGENSGKLCLCIWANHSKRTSIEHRIQRLLKKKFKEESTPLLVETEKQIGEYLNQKRKSFTIKTELVGSDFQKVVWGATSNIGYGKAASYKSLAANLQQEEAIRPISATISSNPLAIITPCHRIVCETKGIAINFEEKANEKLRQIEN